MLFIGTTNGVNPKFRIHSPTWPVITAMDEQYEDVLFFADDEEEIEDTPEEDEESGDDSSDDEEENKEVLVA